MSLYICILIILFSGIGGGLINALLKHLPQISLSTSNKSGLTSAPISRFNGAAIVDSMIFGIGAAILMPLFLEIAHSDLLNHMRSEFSWGKGEQKNYLLFLSYCFLAAISGTEFIKRLAKNVFKSKIIQELKRKIEHQHELIKQIEKESIRKGGENLVLAEKEEAKELQWISKHPGPGVDFEKLKRLFDLKIGDINPVDRQKGRFGGQRENNGRKISATIKASEITGLYVVTVTVEKVDLNTEGLSGYVIFYLHDSFRPCARTVIVKEDKAILPDLKSIGAYTIGAIADNGETFLEYDLSESAEATEEFKSI